MAMRLTKGKVKLLKFQLANMQTSQGIQAARYACMAQQRENKGDMDIAIMWERESDKFRTLANAYFVALQMVEETLEGKSNG